MDILWRTLLLRPDLFVPLETPEDSRRVMPAPPVSCIGMELFILVVTPDVLKSMFEGWLATAKAGLCLKKLGELPVIATDVWGLIPLVPSC